MAAARRGVRADVAAAGPQALGQTVTIRQQPLSIPRGGSAADAAAPTKEKSPDPR